MREGRTDTVIHVRHRDFAPGDADQWLWAQDALGVVTWIWDIDEASVTWIGDLSPLLGGAPGSFSGHFLDYLKHVHPDDATASRTTYLACLRGERTHYRSEERVVWPDGSVHWLETYGRAERGQKGRTRRMMGVVKDVTDRKSIEFALVQSEERFAKFFRASPMAVVVSRLADGLILNVNPRFEEISGFKAAEVIGRTTTELSIWLDTLDRGYWAQSVLERGVIRDVALPFRRKDGRVLSTRMSSARLDLDGEPGVISLIRDITEQEVAEQRFRDSQRQYQAVFQTSPEPIVISRLHDSTMIDVNPAFERALGRPRSETLGRAGVGQSLWVNPEERERAIETIKRDGRISNLETRLIHGNGSMRDVLASGSLVELAGEECIVWAWRDMTEARAAERRRAEAERRHRDELIRMAKLDPLTGLPNRAWLMDRLAAMVDTPTEPPRPFGVLFIDFDGFKKVNDSIGHAPGDELLQEAARRLEGTLSPGDHVARIGGDEFTVIMSSLKDEAEALAMAERLIASFNEPFRLSSGDVVIGLSVGIALYPRDGNDGNDLLRNADIAMYEAKALGRGRALVYTPPLFQRLKQRLDTEKALLEALERHEFELHYQPRVRAADGVLVGFESLVRWRHPKRGLVLPSQFIPLAEETGLILRLGEVVLDRACADLARWRASGLAPLPVSVNASAQEFQRPELPGLIAAALARHQLEPHLLELEITESSTLGHNFDAAVRLSELRDLGVKVLIDDFGTGYSSLSQLQKLQVDVLKIDQSFTAELGHSAQGEVFVRAIIDMAQALDVTVIAEGVETAAQADILHRLHCQELQGYLISRPIPAAEVAALLQSGTFRFPRPPSAL